MAATKRSRMSCDRVTSQTHRNPRRSIRRALGWGWTPCRPTRRCEKPRCPSRSRTWAKRSGDLPPPTGTRSHLRRWPGHQWRRRADWGRRGKRLNPGGFWWPGPWNACGRERGTEVWNATFTRTAWTKWRLWRLLGIRFLSPLTHTGENRITEDNVSSSSPLGGRMWLLPEYIISERHRAAFPITGSWKIVYVMQALLPVVQVPDASVGVAEHASSLTLVKALHDLMGFHPLYLSVSRKTAIFVTLIGLKQ